MVSGSNSGNRLRNIEHYNGPGNHRRLQTGAFTWLWRGGATKMNKKQRDILSDAADILSRISGMRPSNPADTKRLFRAGNIGCEAAGEIMHAIHCVISRHVDNNIDDALYHLDEARKLLEAP